MSQRFGASSLHQRDSRSALFGGYSGSSPSPQHRSGIGSASPSPNPYSYGYSANHGAPSGSDRNALGGYRSATPNKRGQYSDAVLDELESQNDSHVTSMLGKVRVLKDMTTAINAEIRDSSALADKMNDSFDHTRVRLRGTMNRMLVMAERTGVGWKVWLGFFAAVILIFMYAWLF